jgi:hypothetical protein
MFEIAINTMLSPKAYSNASHIGKGNNIAFPGDAGWSKSPAGKPELKRERTDCTKCEVRELLKSGLFVRGG